MNIVLDSTAQGIELTPLVHKDVLFTLLRQTVIPAHRETARHIVQSIAETAGRLKGVTARIGPKTHESPDALIPLEEVFS